MSLKSLSRTRLLPALIAPLLVGVAACDTSTDPGPPSGIFYVLNTGPNYSAAQMRVDQINLGDPLQFWEFSIPLRIRESTEPRLFTLKNGSDTTTLATRELVVSRDSVYLMVITQRPVGAGLLLFRNDSPIPETGKSYLRVVNTSSAAGNVDVYILSPGDNFATATPQDQDIGFEGSTERILYTPPAGTTDSLRVIVTTKDTKTVVSQKTYGVKVFENGDLVPGSIATIFLLNDRNTKVAPVQQFTATGL